VPVHLAPLPSSAAGELLTLQRAAYVGEAQLYADVRLPALVQTLDELRSELVDAACLGARDGGRLVGSERSRDRDGVLHLGRLVVAPDRQGQGIGSRLETTRETLRPGLELVHLVKDLS
jgi:GNAT superfamily N-acetyltransferase